MAQLLVRTLPTPIATLVRIVGEVDIATVSDLRGHLSALPERSTILEMSEVGLLSAAGLTVLLDLQDRLARAGARVVLADARYCVRRVLAITGLDAKFVMASTVADAVELAASELAAPIRQPTQQRAAPTGRSCRSGRDSYRSIW